MREMRRALLAEVEIAATNEYTISAPQSLEGHRNPEILLDATSD